MGDRQKKLNMNGKELILSRGNKAYLRMSLVLIVLIFLTANQKAKAQSLEVGAFGGASYYLGDLNPSKHFIESNLAYGGLVKYNLSKRFALNLSLTQAKLKSDASNFNADHTANQAANLSTQLNEFALMGEFNFFPYAINDRNNFWSPYVLGGLAYFITPLQSGISLPFGLGIKINPLRNFGLSLFWSARKTFTDNIDQLSSIEYKTYNSDWYLFYGLNLTFAIRLKRDNGCRNLINREYY
jgi:hypothetical protein